MAVLDEDKICAAHEVAHGLVARFYGVPLTQMAICADGGGYTDFIPHRERFFEALDISFAGFVAEEQIQGRDPMDELDRFFEEEQYDNDASDVDEILEEAFDILDPEVDIPKSIARVKRILADPHTKLKGKRLVKKLYRNHYIRFKHRY